MDPTLVPEASERLRAELLSVIRRGADHPLDDDEFDRLARAVFEHQFGCNGPYRAFCESREAHPGRIGHWTEIPAVPTDAFKATALTCDPAASPAAVFRTSGTTGGAERRGTHIFSDLTLYDAAVRAGFERHLLGDGSRMPIISLIAAPGEVSDSSLSYMIGEVVREYGAQGSGWFVRNDAVLETELLQSLREMERSGTPALLVGTSFAFLHLLDGLTGSGEHLRLPAGSRIMDTGGFKGRSRELSRADLYRSMTTRLGVPPEYIVNEYGMTEMSSQLYDGVAGSADAEIARRLHVGPAWVRTRAHDPETLEPLAEGAVGVLRHWDLANLGSVAVLQTADMGRVEAGGVQLLGRASGAEARGCSIAMEELLESLRS